MRYDDYKKGDNSGIRISAGFLVLLICGFSALSLFGALGGVGQMVKNFLVGVVGLTSYAYAICGCLIGVAVIFNRRVTLATDKIVKYLLLFALGVLALHIVSSRTVFAGSGYGEYLKLCYEGATAGGVVAGAVLWPVMKVITPVISLIILIALFCLVTLVSFYPYLKKEVPYKTRKVKIENNPRKLTAVNFGEREGKMPMVGEQNVGDELFLGNLNEKTQFSDVKKSAKKGDKRDLKFDLLYPENPDDAFTQQPAAKPAFEDERQSRKRRAIEKLMGTKKTEADESKYSMPTYSADIEVEKGQGGMFAKLFNEYDDVRTPLGRDKNIISSRFDISSPALPYTAPRTNIKDLREKILDRPRSDEEIRRDFEDRYRNILDSELTSKDILGSGKHKKAPPKPEEVLPEKEPEQEKPAKPTKEELYGDILKPVEGLPASIANILDDKKSPYGKTVVPERAKEILNEPREPIQKDFGLQPEENVTYTEPEVANYTPKRAEAVTPSAPAEPVREPAPVQNEKQPESSGRSLFGTVDLSALGKPASARTEPQKEESRKPSVLDALRNNAQAQNGSDRDKFTQQQPPVRPSAATSASDKPSATAGKASFLNLLRGMDMDEPASAPQPSATPSTAAQPAQAEVKPVYQSNYSAEVESDAVMPTKEEMEAPVRPAPAPRVQRERTSYEQRTTRETDFISDAPKRVPIAQNNKEIPFSPEKPKTVARQMTVEDAFAAKKQLRPYKAPPIALLSNQETEIAKEDVSEKCVILEDKLHQFRIDAKVLNVTQGPTFSRFEMKMPEGVKVSKVRELDDDIAMALKAQSVRIEAPIPGMDAFGVEVPNEKRGIVNIRSILSSVEFNASKSNLTFALGKDIGNNNFVCDIDAMPHLLIAGATGSGKSVCINSLIISLVYKASPADLRLILVDPKRVELNVYNGLPHLLMKEVISEPEMAINALQWAINEMSRRYEMFSQQSCRNITEFNKKAIERDDLEKLPQIIIIIDELADLIMMNKREIEDKISKLTRLSRAAGIYLVVATQRPSVDYITGSIKANLPSRIAFGVTSIADSRTILDRAGAEKLLGYGDMLYFPKSEAEPIRLQGCFVSGDEVVNIVNYIKRNNDADFDENIENEICAVKQPVDETVLDGTSSDDDQRIDDKFIDAVRLVILERQASVSRLQRKFALGYTRAARIIDQMEEKGIVSPMTGGNKLRSVNMTPEEFKEMFGEDL